VLFSRVRVGQASKEEEKRRREERKKKKKRREETRSVSFASRTDGVANTFVVGFLVLRF
jgi:hypothetical protein